MDNRKSWLIRIVLGPTVRWMVWSWLVVPSASVAGPVWVESVEEAFQEAGERGRPVMVVVTTATCAPCQILKTELRSGALHSIANEVVLLELDLHSEAFAQFRQLHPEGFNGSVPMIYLFDANGSRHYARAGLVPHDQLSRLVQGAVRASGPSLDDRQLSEMRQVLERVRMLARQGQLIAAYQELQPVSTHAGSAAVVKRGRRYQQELLDAMGRTLSDLDRELANPDQAHAAAVRLAILYVQAGEITVFQQQIKSILSRHAKDAATHDVILQAKYLVRARVAEQRQLRDEAIVNYTQILRIDGESPIGLVAANRLRRTEINAGSGVGR